MNKTKITTILVLLCGLMQAVQAAPLTLKITSWVEDAYPIAVVPFGLEGLKGPTQDVAEIVRNDLVRSGKFNPLPVKDMLSKPSDIEKIKFKDWRVLGSESLVLGQIVSSGNDSFDITFWLYDVFKAKQLDAYSMKATEKSLRAAAHKIADLIYEKLIGEPGAFSTHIAYVTAERKAKETKYSLWIADSDGENPQALINSIEPIMSPSWSPDGEKIAYASLEGDGRQKIYIQHWLTGGRTQVTTINPGLYGAPAWSPDGKQLLFTISNIGNADIYRLDLQSKKLKRLTNHWAIDTEGVWADKGESIIFTSDRSGRPQLYKMSSEGGKVSRLTFDGGENAKAAVSPDGKRLAMVHRVEGEFKIAIMDMASGATTVLTDGVLDESPSFAPNGSMIIYATTPVTTDELGTLATVSTDGRFQQKMSYEGDVREPAWSPLNIK